MGTGSGPGGLNSRIFTNSYAYQSIATTIPNQGGTSFAGLSWPQYSRQTFFSLADCGPGIGARLARHRRAYNIPPIKFIPPKYNN
jgi:hypothetical protein